MRFGSKCEDGFLPVYSVGSEEEARRLLTMSCGTNYQKEFIARELQHDQSLENLDAFSDRLEVMHQMLVKNGRCDCAEG